MPILFRDYETRSTLNLRDVGAWKYSTHATTDAWCCAYAVDEGPIQLWVPGDPVPVEFIEAATNADWIVSAFNDAFERLIEQHIMGPRYGFPLIPIDRHRCSQAAALALSLPAKLETVAAVLGLAEQKDKADAALMRVMAKPRKPRKGEDPNGLYWHDDPERLTQLCAYCKQDTLVERAVHARTGHLPPEEQQLWQLDATINDRGIPIDVKLTEAAICLGRDAQAASNAELGAITGGAVATVGQTEKLIAWLAANECEVKDAQKGTLKQALRRIKISDAARRAMELRLDGAHAAAAKYQRIKSWVGSDNRVRGAFKYHGAATGRWTSLGVQVQNLKKPTVDNLGAAIEAVATGNIAHVRQLHPQPMSVIGDVARAVICAAAGRRFIAADFSGVESRLTAWLAGEQSKIGQWAEFDQTGKPEDEPYYVLGKLCGFEEGQARALGKTADLAFGYGGGEGAWRKLAPEDDASTLDQIKVRQRAWRNAHPAICQLWRSLEREAIRAVKNPAKVCVVNDKLAFKYEGDFLRMRLPSGRKIAYPFPRLHTNDRGDAVVIFKDNAGGKWVDNNHGRGAWGGIWIENAVQATARDLFAAAMLRLEAAGYPVTLHVHDEIVAEVPDGVGSAEDFLKILIEAPAWAAGLPIAAKVRNGPRFCKIKNPEKPAAEAAPHAEALPDGGVSDLWREPQDGPEATPTPEPAEPKTNGAGAHIHEDDDDDGNNADSYNSRKRTRGGHAAFYYYKDASGAPYLRVERTTTKNFFQFHMEGGRWVKGAPAGPKIPYHLPDLIAAAPDVPVWITEGEKDADNVAALGLITTTNPGGAGNWCADLNKWFKGKQTAYLLQDHDEKGRQHTAKIAAALQHIIAEIRTVLFSELPPKGDVSDWIDAGGTREQLLARAKAATRWVPDGYTLVRASDIVPRAMDWLWRGHILRGSQKLLTGIPGGGKSQIHCAFVAYVTTGAAWPDGCNGASPGNVIMLTAEDCLDQTIVPRLIAAGADRDRVYILKKIRRDNKERMFLLGEDIDELDRMITKVGEVRLITIDPITAYMGKLNSHLATDVRGQLGPLADLAERTDVAISAITHPPKHTSQRAIDHFIGSQAFIAAARIGHMAIAEVDEDENGNRVPSGRSLFTNPKNNVSRKMSTLAYRINEKQINDGIKAAYVTWEEIVDVTADQAVAAATPSKNKEASSVTMFLLDILANGPVPAKRIEERAAQRGFSKDQLDRAKKKMSIVAFKEPGVLDGQWIWALPQHTPKPGVT
jgi:DNA polymerase bacteriophage-type